MSLVDPKNEEATIYFESYGSFSKTLRAWLVAYGIGAPVLFVTEDTFSELLKYKDTMTPILGAFVFGICIQVIAALIYKASMWYIMWGVLNDDFKKTKREHVPKKGRTKKYSVEDIQQKIFELQGSVVSLDVSSHKISVFRFSTYSKASFFFMKDLNSAPIFGILLKPTRRIGEEKVASFIFFPKKFSIMRVEQIASSTATVIPFLIEPFFIIRVA